MSGRSGTILLAVIGVALTALAIAIMVSMDAASRHQGGRFYVAVGALVVMGFLDTQMSRILQRRLGFGARDDVDYRRFQLVSLLLILMAGLILFLVAWLLP